MIPLTAAEIVDIVGGRLLQGNGGLTAGGVSIDSRRSGPTDCFFAIAGERHDGHDFVAGAIAAGAVVAVVEAAPRLPAASPAAVIEVADSTAALQALAAWLRRELDPTVVGITGSLGKTTTKELAAELLRLRFSVHATPGNLNNHWGLPLSLLGLEPHHHVMVAEMAMSAPGEIRTLARIAAPDVGLITNVAPAHMQSFADLDEVAAAKGELAEELPDAGTLVVNADDPRTDAMGSAQAARLSRIVRFGRGDGADVRAENLQRLPSGWSFDLCTGDERHDVHLQLPGAAGVSSFLGAAAVAWSVGVAPENIAAHAEALRPLRNRGAVRQFDSVTLLDESYNASPVAVQAALDTLAALPASNRRIAVLGDMLEMGEWTGPAHREVGKHAVGSGIDLLLAVGDHAHLIAAGAADAGMEAAAVRTFDDAGEAAAWLAPRLARGDAVLVKGSRAVHLERVVEAISSADVTEHEVGS